MTDAAGWHMGLMSKILGETGSSRQTGDYVELSAEDFETDAAEADTTVRIARISDQQDVIDIKDAVYDGDIVIADITRHTTQDQTMEHITDELKQVAGEVGGDIVQKDDDQLIITPSGVAISRERLGR
ncbi:putative cell division protein [Halapricum desulfuricans]|uniref:Putative cell division protein n=2 Tax=Halapricum desulfuricans TaxID=2841257 RepID=A0A897N1H8_9EURY|nr:putative cell division protein [Halapricum desulfuricans]